jgi:hypothetical protein
MPGLDRVAHAVEGIGPLLRRHALTVVVELQQAGVEQAHQNLVDQHALDTRAVYDGVQATTPEATADGWSGEVQATAPASIFVERGRRPGAPMPPSGVLVEWMQRHGIPAQAEYAVRRSIARRGIPARPFMRPLGRQLAPEFVRLMHQAADSIRAEFLTSIKD